MTLREEFDRCWVWLEQAVNQELGGAAFTKEQVWSEIACGEATLWPGRNSAAITEIQCNPGRKVLVVWVVGGDTSRHALKELLEEILPKIEFYGKALGCQYIVGSGRTGGAWERVLAKHGFAPVHTTYGKEL